MRLGDSRRFLSCCVVGLAAAWPLGGCTSAGGFHYLHHLSIVVEPAEPGPQLMESTDRDRGLVPVNATRGGRMMIARQGSPPPELLAEEE